MGERIPDCIPVYSPGSAAAAAAAAGLEVACQAIQAADASLFACRPVCCCCCCCHALDVELRRGAVVAAAAVVRAVVSRTSWSLVISSAAA